MNCKSLRSIRLPRGLERIGGFCFSGSEVEEVVFPKTLESANECTLSGCESLRTIYLEEGCGVRCSDVEIPESVKDIYQKSAAGYVPLRDKKIRGEVILDGI